MPGQNDIWPWLQSILQNQGAAQPNSIGGMPRYGAGPGNLGMGDPTGLTAPTPGAPSMGYPAMGALGAAPQPQQPPQPAPDALGFSVGVNPPGGDDHGTGPPAVMSPAEMAAAQAAQAAAQPQPQPATNGQGGIGAYPDSTNYPHAMTPPTFNWPASSTPTGMPAPPPQGSPSATPKPAGPLASPGGGGGGTMKRTPGAPNLGYYQGNNNRFVQVDRPNASAAGGFGRGGPPQMTALNLAGLFGSRGQPAAAPVVNPNVPAANAQPVSATAPNAYPGDAGWNVDARGNPIPDTSSADPTQMSPAALAGAVSKPNWWQQFGRPDMSPGQLASAVRKPNWFRNM